MRTFQQSYHIPGTLSANLAIVSKAALDCTLVHVSAVASNDSDAKLSIGTGADAAAHMAAKVIGDSGTPAEFGRTSFVGSQFPRLAKGDVMQFALDFDGASGTAAANVTLVATFQAG